MMRAIEIIMIGKKKVKVIAAVCIGIAVMVCLVCVARNKLPGWVIWEERRINDTTENYKITLSSRAVSVSRNSDKKIIWKSQKGVKVQDILSCDIDGDGNDELILLCWKRGRFGKYKPFWIKEDEKEWSQHIFVYRYTENQITPMWMSSYIGQDVVKIDAKPDSKQKYYLILTDRNGENSNWAWNYWGFELFKK